MKKRSFVLVFCFSLVLGLSGCDKGKNYVQPNASDECLHDYKFEKYNDNKHRKVCSKCGFSDGFLENHCFELDSDKEAENQEATCTADGWEWQKCKLCGATRKLDIQAKGHSFTVVKSTTATCTEAGENTMKCSICGEECPEKQPAEALGHNLVADESFTEGLRASCTGEGTAREKCTRCDYTQIVAIPALGHEFVPAEVATPKNNFATLTTSPCTHTDCGIFTVTWSALEVDDNCKNNRYAYQWSDGVYNEPNYVVNDDNSISFFGRPIHNAMELGYKDGKSWQYKGPVYDADVDGSYFEYNIDLETSIGNATLFADMTPTQDMLYSDLYNAIDGDWTAGLKDSVDNKYEHRYVITVDGVEQTFHEEEDNICQECTRGIYKFPLYSFDLSKGVHTIRITMAGGFISKFYGFGLMSGFRNHGGQHLLQADASKCVEATCTTDGYYYGVCTLCGYVKEYVIPKSHKFIDVESDINRAATCEGPGVQERMCEICRCREEVVVPALGHDFIAEDAINNAGYASLQPYTCRVDNIKRYVMDAKDVTDATENDRRLISTSSSGGDTEMVYEPNYVINSNGSVQFYGRPIHNAMALPDNAYNYNPVYDADVKGSFIEYKFKLPENVSDAYIVADITPARYMNNIYMFANTANDWLPGLSAEGEVYPTRYIVTLNGNVLEQDVTKDVIAGENRDWFRFPIALQSFNANTDYTLRITMAGGYIAQFWNIGIQTVAPEL